MWNKNINKTKNPHMSKIVAVGSEEDKGLQLLIKVHKLHELTRSDMDFHSTLNLHNSCRLRRAHLFTFSGLTWDKRPRVFMSKTLICLNSTPFAHVQPLFHKTLLITLKKKGCFHFLLLIEHFILYLLCLAYGKKRIFGNDL